MPSVPAETLERLSRLAQEHRITFAGDLPPSEWPRCHMLTLERARALGETKLDSFATEPGVTSNEPWKAQVKSQASLLVEKSRRCRQRNESSWRFACEPLIFARLEAEVACKNCRKRIWRSELEASQEETSKAAEALRKRQRRREPCRCPRAARSQDYLEAVGLNQIFGHREDEPVRLERAVAEILRQYIQKPDAIFGLRQTRNIENLLYDTRKKELELELELESDAVDQDRQIHELLDPSPLTQPINQKGDMLLFPFLVVEAKSGTSDSDWYSIQMQTAFPIKTFLDTQDRLRRATGRRSKWHTGPLVWFFANKGEDWSLSAAYMEQGEPRANTSRIMDYLVVELWRGSISTRDGALQLLLLVDYIFDWARDVYRDYIIRELRTLASGANDAASTVYSDTDIYSTRPVEYNGVPDQEDIENFQHYISGQKEFTALDSANGVVRHATFVESRYCAVFVTPDNVQTLLQSTRQTKTQQLCRLILGHMPNSIFLDLSTLVAMEMQWTGNSRLSPPGYLAQMKFYSVVSCTNYLSGGWHQVRELYVMAIAEGAWEAIVDASKLKKGRGKALKPSFTFLVNTDSMLATLKSLQAGSPAEALLAAITRRAVTIQATFTDRRSYQRGSPRMSSIDTSSSDSSSARIGSVDTSPSDTSSIDLAFSEPGLCIVVPDSGVFRDIVHYIYKFFKKGNMEPQESFMRVSKRYDFQHLLQSDVNPVSIAKAPLQVSSSKCVLISSGCHSHDPERSTSVCIYIVEGEPTAPTQDQLFERLMETMETRDVYHTTQNNGTSNLTGMKEVPWNLKSTYGIFSMGYEFLRFLMEIGPKIRNYALPATQGSPRQLAESGSYIFTREHIPWQDARLLGGNIRGRIFMIYKLMTSEILYWKTKAERLNARGITCCRICAGSTEGDISNPDSCSMCNIAMRDYDGPSWVLDVIFGINPFPEGDTDDGYYSDSDFLLRLPSRGVPWKKNLAGFPGLDKSFKDLTELYSQYTEFTAWSRKKEDERRRRPLTKRKRQVEDGDSQEERQHNDDPDYIN